MQWLLNHGADMNAQQDDYWTSLHIAAFNTIRNRRLSMCYSNTIWKSTRRVPREALLGPYVLVGNVVDIVQQLPEHGTDTNIPDCSQSLLREASSRGSLEVARLLLSYGANIDEKNWPYQGDATKSLDSH